MAPPGSRRMPHCGQGLSEQVGPDPRAAAPAQPKPRKADMSVPHLAQAAGQKQLTRLGGGIMCILLDENTTGGRPTTLRPAPAAGSASPVHVHARQHEIVVLPQGIGIFWAGEDRYELSDSGVAALPHNVPHAYRHPPQTVDMLAGLHARGHRGVLPRGWLGPVPPRPGGWEITPGPHGSGGRGRRTDHPRAAARRRPDDSPGLPDRPRHPVDNMAASMEETRRGIVRNCGGSGICRATLRPRTQRQANACRA